MRERINLVEGKIVKIEEQIIRTLRATMTDTKVTVEVEGNEYITDEHMLYNPQYEVGEVLKGVISGNNFVVYTVVKDEEEHGIGSSLGWYLLKKEMINYLLAYGCDIEDENGIDMDKVKDLASNFFRSGFEYNEEEESFDRDSM